MTDPDLRHLSLAYAAAVDSLDGAAFAALFAPDGELWVPDLRRGRSPSVRRRGAEELGAVPAGLARYHATHHRVAVSTFDVRGEEATGSVQAVAHHVAATRSEVTGSPPRRSIGAGTDTIWYLTYEDSYRLLDGRWRFARRVLQLRDIEERVVDHLGPGRRRLPG